MLIDIGSNWNVALRLRFVTRKLREELDMSQEDLAFYAGLKRTEVVKVESGANKGTTMRIQEGLARGFGLSHKEWRDYVEERLSLADTKARAHAGLAARKDYQERVREKQKAKAAPKQKPDADSEPRRRRRASAA